MKKLGKKLRNNAGTLQMYAFCNCTNCACGVSVNSTSSKYTNQKTQRD